MRRTPRVRRMFCMTGGKIRQRSGAVDLQPLALHSGNHGMAATLTQKILESHLVSGRLEAGEEIAIRIDQTLTQDATGTMAYLQFEAMLLRPQHRADRFRKRGRPPIPDEHRPEIRSLSVARRKRHLSPSPSGALRQAGPHPDRIGQSHPDRGRPRSVRPRCRRSRRRPGHGGRAFLSDLPPGRPHQPHGRPSALGFRQRHHPPCLAALHDEGQRRLRLRIRRGGDRDADRAGAGDHHEHGRRMRAPSSPATG